MATAAKSKKQNGMLRSFNPATGAVLGEVRATNPAEVSEIVARARKVAPEWAAIPPQGRAGILREVRYRIYDLMDEIVETVSAECGKPRAEALAHDTIPPLLTMYYLERLAPKVLQRQKVGGLLAALLGYRSHMEFRPHGVVGVITPWNYPITNCFMAFAGALFAGNTVVIKPSEVTPRSGELIRKLLEPLPSGVASVIQGGGDVGAALVDAPCDKISFIGSPATGRRICEAAAKHLTPVVMELGGKDAAIVCDDADIDVASSGILWGSFYNAGQTCCSIERTYVVDSVADAFEEKLVAKLHRVEQGRHVGPLTFEPQLGIVREQVADAVKKGARILAGGPEAGRRNENGSLWYAPTVVTDVTDEMDVLTKETFGPVLNIVRVRDEDEAIRRANEDGVNLTASVWTTDSKKADRVSRELKAGSITVNLHGESASAPWGTWGGVGESGYGRLNGELGILEFSVPVHVDKNALPKMKRAFWYPYDESTERLFRSLAQAFGSRGVSSKLASVPSIIKSFRAAGKSRI